jgi:hypothetical protein
MQEVIHYESLWTICKYESDMNFQKGIMLEQPSIFEGNCLLNEGITALLRLLAGLTEDAYSNAKAYIGVGDASTPAASATQTGLQAVTNHTYKAMETSYPTVVDQTITFRSVFGSSDGNYDWEEFTVANAGSGAGDNLNRKVSSQGTKVSGQVWTINLAITIY